MKFSFLSKLRSQRTQQDLSADIDCSHPKGKSGIWFLLYAGYKKEMSFKPDRP